MRKKFSLSIAILVLAQIFFANASADYYDGNTGRLTDINAVVQSLQSGQVVILSEQHDNQAHHQNQRDFLVKISGSFLPMSVGMEFFSYPDQSAVDAYVSGELEEDVFLKKIQWGGFPFENYRFQVRLPHSQGGKTLALNLPRDITSKVSRGGLQSLTIQEKALLPPHFVLGNAQYFERFTEAMKDHIKDPTALQNYFTAHCLWDETMAWRTVSFLRDHPNHLLVIIVGDFHVAYEDGLVERLRAQGVRTTVISQVTDISQVAPDVRYGRRGDFVWLP